MTRPPARVYPEPVTRPTETMTVVPVDNRTSAQRVEDLAFENRIRFLTHHRRWAELEAVQMVYASALADREAGLC